MLLGRITWGFVCIGMTHLSKSDFVYILSTIYSIKGEPLSFLNELQAIHNS